MKKLLFALAGTAAFAAFAADPDPQQDWRAGDIDVLGFENFNLELETVTGAVVNRTDAGIEGTSKWSCSGDDASLVKTYGGDNAAKGNVSYPAPFSDEGDQYLYLDTNGSELQRLIDSSNAVPVAATGTYIDTLVQFTPSESAPTAADLAGAKLAIWLGVVNNVTNLYVQAGAIDDQGVLTSHAYKLNATAEAGKWYRLTVTALKNVMAKPADQMSSEGYLNGFQIQLDGGSPLAAAEDTVFDDAFITGTVCDADWGWLNIDDDAAIVALLRSNTIFPSLAGMAEMTATLTSVGFKGTGAIDDFVVTTEAPEFGPATIDFSLTWPAGLTAVSYQIGEGEPVAISGASPLAVPGLVGGETVKFIVQNADGAQKTLTATAADGDGIDATSTTFTWADYLGDAVDGAYEIDDLAELKLFQKGVANTNELTTANTTFKLTADIALDAAWPGIGLQNGKDVYNTQQFDDEAFLGTFDGQNHTISGFQMQGGGLDYCGFFNSAYGATIQNLKIAYAGALFATDTTQNSSAESGATFVGVAKNSTLRNLTTVAGTVSCDKGFGGIVGYLTSGTLVESCTNNVNMTSLKPNKCGGIAMITQGGSAVTVRDCQNNGTIAGSNETGSLIGFIGLDTFIENCESTVAYKLFHHNSGVAGIQGITAVASVDSYTGAATTNVNFATVDNGVATFVADDALAAGNIYKVMHTATATYEFAAAGSISFDTNLIQAVTFAITAAQGLDAPTEATANGVVTFTVAAAGGDDYVVEIEGSDVVITPQAGDLEALAEAGVDTNSVAAVNAALATEIGTTGIPAWQAAFLGLPPTEAGLESFKIDSIEIVNGNVVVTLPNGVDPKTGRGVNITIKLMKADTPNAAAADWTQVETAGGSDNKTFAPFAPGSGETKKFYKVVVEYSGSSN